MIKKIKGIIAVLKREVNCIIRDKDLITIILLSPLFYAFFYGSVYLNKTEENVPVVVVDMDKTSLSQTLIRMLDANQLVNINEIVPDLNTAQDRVNSFKAHGVLFIPKGFENFLKSGKSTDLKLYLNTSRFLISNDINKAVNEVTGTLSAGIRLKYFETQGYSFEQAKELIEPLNGEVKSLFNPGESYGDFLIPGLLVLILQQTLLMGIAESVAKEREENTIYGLYSASNKSVWSAVVGKGSFYLLLFSSYAFLFFTLHFSIFKISFRGSVIAVVIAAILFLVAAVYIAILASSFLKRKIVALQIFAFTTYPVFLMSGYPWPHQAMPWFIKYISFFFPSTPFLNVFSRLTQMGAGWNDVLPELTHLTILALSALVLARLRFGNLIKHSEAEISKEEKIGIDNLDLSEV